MISKLSLDVVRPTGYSTNSASIIDDINYVLETFAGEIRFDVKPTVSKAAHLIRKVTDCSLRVGVKGLIYSPNL